MNLEKFLSQSFKKTASKLLLSAGLFITGCGTQPTDNRDFPSNNISNPTTNNPSTNSDNNQEDNSNNDAGNNSAQNPCASLQEPYGPSPRDGASNVSVDWRTQLDWEPPTNVNSQTVPVRYEVYFGSGENPSFIGETDHSSWDSYLNLQYSTTYHWELRSITAGCGVIQGPRWYFTTEKAPIRDDCPNDPNKTSPGICGCGLSDIDSDSDGTPDCFDICASDSNKTEPGACGCNVRDIDSDSDGTPDCVDNCPNDSNKINPGECGCNSPDIQNCGMSNLELVATLPVSGKANKLFIHGNNLFIAKGHDGIDIADVSNHKNPWVKGHYDSFGEVIKLYYDGETRLYSAEAFSGFSIIDVSDVSNPRRIGSKTNINGATNDIVAKNFYSPTTRYAYVANSPLGIITFDVTNPDDIKELGRDGTSYAGTNGLIYIKGVFSNDRLFASVFVNPSERGAIADVQVFNMSEPQNPKYESGYFAPGAVHGLEETSSIYALMENGGFTKLDNRNAQPIDIHSTNNIITGLAHVSGGLAASSQSGGVYILDTSNGYLSADSVELSGKATDVTSDLSRVIYVANGENGVKIFEYNK